MPKSSFDILQQAIKIILDEQGKREGELTRHTKDVERYRDLIKCLRATLAQMERITGPKDSLGDSYITLPPKRE
jgi:hypothetical protein